VALRRMATAAAFVAGVLTLAGCSSERDPDPTPPSPQVSPAPATGTPDGS
jgi:hypothetical protein